MSRVRPGVLLVRASACRPKMALIALDLPAFDRPAKATSAPESAGKCAGAAALSRNRAWGNRATVVVYYCRLSHHGSKRERTGHGEKNFSRFHAGGTGSLGFSGAGVLMRRRGCERLSGTSGTAFGLCPDAAYERHRRHPTRYRGPDATITPPNSHHVRHHHTPPVGGGNARRRVLRARPAMSNPRETCRS